ncbi:cyanate lyase C-terminal domain-containing protein [Haematococcus lacustris]
MFMHSKVASAQRPARGVALHATPPSQVHPSKPSRPAKHKPELIDRLLSIKESSGKTFSAIAKEVGCTNVYLAQLMYNQAQLKPAYVDKLKCALPGLSDEDIADMQRAPMRRFDPELIQEPLVYRFYEAVMHNGEALKAIINEECGDGIMSAIDMYATVDQVEGKYGERRVVVTLNGKYLPFIIQDSADNVANRD